MTRLGRFATSVLIVALVWSAPAAQGAGAGWEQVHPPHPAGVRNAVSDIVFADGRWVVACNDGTVLIGPDGRSWHTLHFPDPENTGGWATRYRWLVAAGGGRIVLVDRIGTTTVSSNGVDWERSESFVLNWASEIAWTGDQFVAIGEPFSDHGRRPPRIATSEDGLEWTVRLDVSDHSPWIFHLRIVSLGGRVLAGPLLDDVSDPPIVALVVSDDGVSWSPVEVEGDLKPFLMTATGDHLAAATIPLHGGSPSRMAVSDGGFDWGDTGLEVPAYPSDLACLGHQCVVLDRDDNLFAVDLDSGTLETVASPVGVHLRTVACGPYGCLAGGDSRMVLYAPQPAGPWTITHRDGIWPALERAAVDRGRWIAVGSPERPSPDILTSPDGVSWSAAAIADATVALHAVAAIGGGFVAVGDGGAILSSPDGASWTPRRSPTDATLRALAVLGDRAVAVGGDDHGVILAGGLSGEWAVVNPSSLPPLHDVTRAGEVLVAVGDTGAVLSSLDGLSWAPQPTDLIADIHSIATNGYRWLAVIDDGSTASTVLSDDGLRWLTSARTTEPSDRLTWSGRAFYAISGDGAWISPDGVHWTVTASLPGARDVISDGEHTILVGTDGGILHRTELTSPAEAARTRLAVPAVVDRDLGGRPEWRSELRLRRLASPSGAARTSLFLPTDGDGFVVRDLGLTAAGVRISDLLPGVFGQRSAPAPVIVLADAAMSAEVEVTHLTGGTAYRQRILSVDLTADPGQREQLLLVALPAEPCRTNLVLLDASDQPTLARVEILDASGAVVRRRVVPLQPWQTKVVSDALGGLTIADGAPVALRISPVGDDPPPAVMATLVDLASGDVVTVLPAASAGTALAIPSVAHSAGLAGSRWTSDLVLHNPGPDPARFQLELRRTGERFGVFSSPELALAAGASVAYPDVVASVLGTAGSGWLRVVPTTGRLAAWSRTWDGTAPSPLGQAVPAVVERELPPTQQLTMPWLPVATDASPGWRSNLGLVAVDGAAVVSIHVGCEPGSGPGHFQTAIWSQMTRSFALAPPAGCGASGQPTSLAITVRVDMGGPVIAWASSVHAPSGDALFALAEPSPVAR